LVEFQRALEVKPTLAAGYLGRAGVYYRRKQYPLALADYDQAIRINPLLAQAYADRARVREAVGDFSGAAADRRSEAALRQK
jgi:tetratricopeptide (TPR) repeat protein